MTYLFIILVVLLVTGFVGRWVLVNGHEVYDAVIFIILLFLLLIGSNLITG